MSDAKKDPWSLIVRKNSRLEFLPGDYSKLQHDGMRPLQCVSVHEGYDAVAKAYREAMTARSSILGDKKGEVQ